MSPDKKPRVHIHELDPRAVLLTMLGVLTAIFMGALDSTIVATALPAGAGPDAPVVGGGGGATGSGWVST